MAFVPFVESDQPTMAAFNEKFQQTIDTALAAGVQISVGGYIGTGAETKSLTFDFTPYLVVVGGDHSSPEDTVSMVRGISYARYYLGSNTGSAVTVSWDKKTVSWNGANGALAFNGSGSQYRYVGLGKKEG